MNVNQWVRLLCLVFIFNGVYLANADKWEECGGSGDGEERADRIPKDLQQLIGTLVMVVGVLLIIGAAGVWLRLKVVRATASEVEELQAGFCCRVFRFIIFPSNTLPLWQSLLCKGFITVCTTVVGAVMSMFLINLLAPDQEPLRETLEDIFNLKEEDFEDDGRFKRSMTTTQMPMVRLDPLETICWRATTGQWTVNDQMESLWQTQEGAQLCYLVMVLVITAVTFSLLVSSPLVWGLVYVKFVQHLRTRDVERQEAEGMTGNEARETRNLINTQQTSQTEIQMPESRNKKGSRRKAKATSSKAVHEGKETRNLTNVPMDNNCSLRSQQECCQGKHRQPTRKELLTRTVAEWMQGEEHSNLRMNQTSREGGAVEVMETTFCDTDQEWIQLSAENTPTGAVPEMGEDGI